MKKIGVVFPGQGSQYVGMGKSFYDGFEEARALFGRADEAIGYPLSSLCFNGPEDELRQTFNTQPALLTVSYIVWTVLKNTTGIAPFLLAGHSLGEYTALLAGGFFAFEDAVRITRTRGLLMEAACPKGKGAMAALIGADMAKIEPVLREISHDDYVVVPANLNSDEQVVLSGDAEALKEAVERLKGTGYKKAVFLNVSGPFHSPLMGSAADKLKTELDGLTTSPLACAVVTNVDAMPTADASVVRDKLYGQMFSPVRWADTVRRMAGEGVEVFLEVGPQKVLANLIRRILPGAVCLNVGEPADMEAVKEAIE